jgi:oligosaccharide reducing-end xylanase
MLRMGAIMLLLISALATSLSPASAQKSVPASGAFYSGNWNQWNLFASRGKTATQIDTKLTNAYNQLFKTGDASTQRLCFDYAPDTSMAYIKTIDQNDIRSEGISYGMMAAVEMNDQPLFNKLWKFARINMKQDGYPQQGYFAWQIKLNPNGTLGAKDSNTASDGDIWMAMALFNASGRWGNAGAWPFNYKQEANYIINAMLHREEINGGQPSGLTNMFNSYNQVVFTPKNGLNNFTDPSYHLPAFFEYFARYGGQDNPKWWNITYASREYLLPRATGYSANVNFNASTALSPGYSTFDGTRTNLNGNNEQEFTAEAHRVVSNIAVDYMWWGDSNARWNFHKNFGNRLLNFFASQPSYISGYTTNGSPNLNANYRSASIIAMNATGAQVATTGNSWSFVDELWNSGAPTGNYRYYDGCLHMLGLLQSSGRFRFWAPQ